MFNDLKFAIRRLFWKPTKPSLEEQIYLVERAINRNENYIAEMRLIARGSFCPSCLLRFQYTDALDKLGRQEVALQVLKRRLAKRQANAQ